MRPVFRRCRETAKCLRFLQKLWANELTWSACECCPIEHAQLSCWQFWQILQVEVDYFGYYRGIPKEKKCREKYFKWIKKYKLKNYCHFIFNWQSKLPETPADLFPKFSKQSELVWFVYAWVMSFGQGVEFWNWCWMLKCVFTFLFTPWLKRRTSRSAIFIKKSPNLF